MTRLAYLGPAGTFTEQAAAEYDPNAELVPFPSEHAVATALEEQKADQGVLPVENSLDGSVTGTLDVLVHDSELQICGEVVLPVELCLIVQPGMKQQDVEVVYSKPIALNQCRKFLEQNYPNVRQASTISTTGAVQKIMAEAGAAAIGAERAAEQYGAEVLARGVQDSTYNKTRFVVLDETDCDATGRDKTSIAFAVSHDRAGTLVEVLHEFADRSINLTKIESRPSREELGIYIFLIDMEGHRTDADVADALAAVESTASFYRILGSYPCYDDAGDS
jgi:prephenate dehydratase